MQVTVAKTAKKPSSSEKDLHRPQHPIQVVARRTGLSADLIRAWERRYNAVSPERTQIGRRLYSDQDIDRLALLRRAIHAGRRIGDVAQLSRTELARLVAGDTAAAAQSPSAPDRATAAGATGEQHVESCIRAVMEMRPDVLESALASAAVAFSQPVVLEEIIAPLLQYIGEQCRVGSLRSSQEHAASVVIRAFLSQLLAGMHAPVGAPVILVGTPVGQNHELGALMAAVAAASEEWKVIYLGPNLPADEIAYAANQTGARAVALSIVYPSDDVRLPDELRRLRAQMPQRAALITGGSGSSGYDRTLAEIHAIRAQNLDEFRLQLQKLRVSASP
jgi:DNA-binding transcriptional MerR regulator/methylmalonyl-CoA mutase cobalamin-binding subunit